MTEEEAARVVYRLYMSGGYERLLEGDRVIVRVPNSVANSKTNGKDGSTNEQDERAGSARTSAIFSKTGSDKSESPGDGSLNVGQYKHPVEYDDQKLYRDFHGEVVRVRLNGMFDVAYDDGGTEKLVRKLRAV